MLKEMSEYAMTKAGLTPEQYQKARSHAASCGCRDCQKFDVYLRIRCCIEEWETHKRVSAKAKKV